MLIFEERQTKLKRIYFLFQFFFNLLLTLFSASKVVGFVVRENRVEVESGVGEKEKHEVVVTYGDELENILRKAAAEGRKSLIEEILNGEVTFHNIV